MMHTLSFVTSNRAKFEDVKKYIAKECPQINLVMHPLELPEVQSLDIKDIAIKKAEDAYSALQVPVLVDDGGIFIEHYHQFPGAFSKYIVQQIGLQGIWTLAQSHPRVYFQSYLVYKDANHLYCATGTTKGRLVEPPLQEVTTQYPYTHMFIADGTNQLYSDLRAQGLEEPYSHRKKAVQELVKYISLNCF